jgi:xanthine phosphoribosyltransferase
MFLNHQIDVDLLCEIGKEFRKIFDSEKINKIVTIEASGIGIACVAAQYFSVPVVFAKKNKTANVAGGVYTTVVHSYTHNTDHKVCVSKSYLGKGDRVLIIDDFLANGSALNALIELCRQSGAEIAGAGIVIEKAYQEGGKLIRDRGIRVESLARVASMSDDGSIEFC